MSESIFKPATLKGLLELRDRSEAALSLTAPNFLQPIPHGLATTSNPPTDFDSVNSHFISIIPQSIRELVLNKFTAIYTRSPLDLFEDRQYKIASNSSDNRTHTSEVGGWADFHFGYFFTAQLTKFQKDSPVWTTSSTGRSLHTNLHEFGHAYGHQVPASNDPNKIYMTAQLHDSTSLIRAHMNDIMGTREDRIVAADYGYFTAKNISEGEGYIFDPSDRGRHEVWAETFANTLLDDANVRISVTPQNILERMMAPIKRLIGMPEQTIPLIDPTSIENFNNNLYRSTSVVREMISNHQRLVEGQMDISEFTDRYYYHNTLHRIFSNISNIVTYDASKEAAPQVSIELPQSIGSIDDISSYLYSAGFVHHDIRLNAAGHLVVRMALDEGYDLLQQTKSWYREQPDVESSSYEIDSAKAIQRSFSHEIVSEEGRRKIALKQDSWSSDMVHDPETILNGLSRIRPVKFQNDRRQNLIYMDEQDYRDITALSDAAQSINHQLNLLSEGLKLLKDAADRNGVLIDADRPYSRIGYARIEMKSYRNAQYDKQQSVKFEIERIANRQKNEGPDLKISAQTSSPEPLDPNSTDVSFSAHRSSAIAASGTSKAFDQILLPTAENMDKIRVVEIVGSGVSPENQFTQNPVLLGEVLVPSRIKIEAFLSADRLGQDAFARIPADLATPLTLTSSSPTSQTQSDPLPSIRDIIGEHGRVSQMGRGIGIAMGVQGLAERFGENGTFQSDAKREFGLAVAGAASDVVAVASDTAEMVASSRLGSQSRTVTALLESGDDLARLSQAASGLRTASQISRVATPVAMVATIASGAIDAEIGRRTGDGQRVATAGATTVGGIAGGLAGAATVAQVGATAGAAIGVFFGGVGAVPGAAIGGAIGAVVGGIGGAIGGAKISEVIVESTGAGRALQSHFDRESLTAPLAQINQDRTFIRQFDFNRDGELSVSELRSILNRHGYTSIASLDTNNNGSVTPQELRQRLIDIAPDEQRYQQGIRQIETKYDHIDSTTDIRRRLLSGDPPMTDAERRQVLQALENPATLARYRRDLERQNNSPEHLGQYSDRLALIDRYQELSPAASTRVGRALEVAQDTASRIAPYVVPAPVIQVARTTLSAVQIETRYDHIRNRSELERRILNDDGMTAQEQSRFRSALGNPAELRAYRQELERANSSGPRMGTLSDRIAMVDRLEELSAPPSRAERIAERVTPQIVQDVAVRTRQNISIETSYDHIRDRARLINMIQNCDTVRPQDRERLAGILNNPQQLQRYRENLERLNRSGPHAGAYTDQLAMLDRLQELPRAPSARTAFNEAGQSRSQIIEHRYDHITSRAQMERMILNDDIVSARSRQRIDGILDDPNELREYRARLQTSLSSATGRDAQQLTDQIAMIDRYQELSSPARQGTRASVGMGLGG
jgi:hypothetical protein